MKRNSTFLLATFLIFLGLFLSGCSPLNENPVARFTADPTEGKAPLEVSFDASASSDPDGEIVSYDWKFDDGETGTGETVNHTFESDGEYKVTLTVRDDEEETDTKETTISVNPENQQPTASFTTTATSSSTSYYVNFNSDSTDPDGTIVSYEWSLGDGSTATGDTTTHTYYSSGDYNIQLTVTDNEGATSSVAKTLSLPPGSNTSPSASFTADPTEGKAPLEVSFDASDSSDPDGKIVSYDWDFDDGETGTGETVDHTFESGGEYEVTLTVTDDEGAKSNIKGTVDVASDTPPTPGSG